MCRHSHCFLCPKKIKIKIKSPVLFPFHRKIETEEIKFSSSSQRRLLVGLLLTFPGFFLVRLYSPQRQGLSHINTHKSLRLSLTVCIISCSGMFLLHFWTIPSLPGNSDERYAFFSKKNAQMHPQNTAVNSVASWASQDP